MTKTKNIWSGIRTTKAARSQVFAGGRDSRLRDTKLGRARQQLDPVFTISDSGRPFKGGYTGQTDNIRAHHPNIDAYRNPVKKKSGQGTTTSGG